MNTDISISFSRVQNLHTMVTIFTYPSARSTVDIIINAVLNTVNLQTCQTAVVSDSVVRSAILLAVIFKTSKNKKEKEEKG